MHDQNGLGLGTAQRGTPGRKVLVKNTSAGDMATLRDTFGYKTDPIDGKTLLFASVDSAINAVSNGSRTNLGDTIYISEGYAETISAASGVDQDAEGISIIGLGEGADRPVFTFSDVAATWTMAAANSVLKNVIFTPSVDSVVSPLVISAADCTVDVEMRDASSTVEFVRGVLTTADADGLDLKLRYVGFTAGNACVNAVRLVGGSNARVDVDFYGKASTAVVEFHTTAVENCNVEGYMYNSGTTDLSKSVVDTATGSTWWAEFRDGAAGYKASGGSAAALAGDDVGAVSAAVAVIDGYHDVPATDSVNNAQMRDVVGSKADAASTGAPTGTKSLMAYAKQNVGNGQKIDSGALAASPNASSLAAYVASGGTALGTALPASTSLYDVVSGASDLSNPILGKKVTRAAADIFDGTTTSLFTVSGGRVLITHVELEVTGAQVDNTVSNTKLQSNPTLGTTVDLCANLNVQNDEIGTLYTITGTFADALQGVASGAQVGMEPKGVIVPEGTIDVVSSADAGTGGALISAEVWYMVLDSGAAIAAA